MENASKALLIAAAVLIVVLLIAFGVRIFKSASTAGNADTTATEIQSGINAGTLQLNQALQGAITADGTK